MIIHMVIYQKRKYLYISEDNKVLNLNNEFNLKGIIFMPNIKHYYRIIFNPLFIQINDYFQSN